MKKYLILVSLFAAALFIVLPFTKSRETFAARKRSNSIVLQNLSNEHYPGVEVKFSVNEKVYRSRHKFIPGKGSVKLQTADFSDSTGDTLTDLETVSNIEVSGGDSIINESVSEEVLVH